MIAQISLFLDESGQLHAEAPSATGARRKLELSFSNNLTLDQIKDLVCQNALLIAEELCSQQAEIAHKRKEQEKKLATERKRTILTYTAAHHPDKYVAMIDGGAKFLAAQLQRKSNCAYALEAEQARANEIEL